MNVFGVDYQFLSCGDVFTQGLAHAAEALGVEYQHALWNDRGLPLRIQSFAPDLLFVVHGRRFCQQGGRSLLRGRRSAIWLLDEPYEVDNTAQFSAWFDHVFVNDPATIHRHRSASYLPVCADPVIHRSVGAERPHVVGFIGGGNATRDRYLEALARAGLLSYVIGGPWSDPAVRRLCRSANIPASELPAWYQSTRIVLNVFRERHHYNRQAIPATSLNPRVYEALACGALVVSEWRPEVETLVPELPTFRSIEECLSVVQGLLADPNRAETIRRQCAARLSGHTYAARLETVLATMGAAVAA